MADEKAKIKGTPDKRDEAAPQRRIIEVPDVMTVRELATLMGISPIRLIKELMRNGIMANINQSIDYDSAVIVAEDLGFELRKERPAVPGIEVEEEAPPARPPWPFFREEDRPYLVPRPPVVTVMGHVDHGKTSLLDVIRQTNVVAGEAGGITQHIGAYQVQKQGKKITFIDTPGHEAFTAMRARGAQVTDIAVLVVAADDGVMPQTLEAIDHARAAQVPIVVALNKIDKDTANPERVKQQLSDVGLTPDDWGGDTLCVPVSAKTGEGIEDLLDAILLVSEDADLKANPNRPAAGTVIEGELDRSRGPVATALVQAGTLRVGDYMLVGDRYGRVRAMFDEDGKRVQEAGPSTPVAILGLSDVPQAGDIFQVVGDEKAARTLAAQRAEEKRLAALRPTRGLSLDEVYAQMQAGQVKELNLILKADVQGALEPIRTSLEKLGDEGLRVNIIRQDTGAITESDIMLAVASKAIVIGFNVRPDPAGRLMAEAEGVDVRYYDVIYQLIDDIEKALKGLLEPKYEKVVIGQAEVRAIFDISRRGKVAGLYVQEGKVTRDALARVLRDGQEVYDGRVASLKRYANDVKEVAAGFECGLGLENFQDFQEGDIIEFYAKERVG
ncbi:MAG: translation initiation factor IF-2 [Anaerolineae bacterium]